MGFLISFYECPMSRLRCAAERCLNVWAGGTTARSGRFRRAFPGHRLLVPAGRAGELMFPGPSRFERYFVATNTLSESMPGLTTMTPSTGLGTWMAVLPVAVASA